MREGTEKNKKTKIAKRRHCHVSLRKARLGSVESFRARGSAELSMPVRLKMTGHAKQQMHQAMKIQKSCQELCSGVAVPFQGSIISFTHVELVVSRGIASRSISAAVIQARPVDEAGRFSAIVVSGMSNTQKLPVLLLREESRRRVRNRLLRLQMQGAERQFTKFHAEAPQARSANLFSEINTNVGSQRAARFAINQKTEQHRCTAA